MLRRPTVLVLGTLVALAAYLLFWPVSITPLAWEAPEAPPLAGPYAPNERLGDVRVIPLTDGAGPEDVAVDGEGRVYGGLLDGRIVRRTIDDPDASWETFADTGGRPLGFAWDDEGRLLVADADAGLLRITPDGTIETLSTEADGIRYGFTDDLDVGPDGTIYFSDASWKYGVHEWQDDAFEHGPYGRLLAYDPDHGEARVLLDQLYFANGVAVAEDGSYVLVNETWTYRVYRYWLHGPKAGSTEVFLDNLPGFPDGISRGTDGIYWIAIASPRNPILDRTAAHPWLRKVIHRLPRFLHPAPRQYGFVLGVDGEGSIRYNLQATESAPYAPITSVEEHEGVLWLGSLTAPAVASLPRP